jgi:hypothetical protein
MRAKRDKLTLKRTFSTTVDTILATKYGLNLLLRLAMNRDPEATAQQGFPAGIARIPIVW